MNIHPKHYFIQDCIQDLPALMQFMLFFHLIYICIYIYKQKVCCIKYVIDINNITMKKSINSISAGKSCIVMQETLRLINVISLKVEDAGLYTCLASSLAGEDGKNHWVRVQGDTSFSYVLFNLAEIYHFPPLSELPLTCTWNMMNRSLRTLRSKDQGLRKVKCLALAFSAYSHAKLLYCVSC